MRSSYQNSQYPEKRKPVLGVSLSGFNQAEDILVSKILAKFDIVNPDQKSRDREEIFRRYKNCDVIVSGTEPIDKLVLESQKLKLILRAGIGNDNFPLGVAKRKKIMIHNAIEPVVESVSSLAQTAILAISLGLIQNRLNPDSAWRSVLPLGIENTRISILGFGRIGSRLLEKLIQSGFKTFNLYDKEDLRKKISIYSKTGLQINQENLATCFSNSDIVSINLPLSEETKGLVNLELMRRMCSNAWLLNFARGGIVVQDDLLVILKEERIQGAILDVFDEEPYLGPLLQEPRAFLTPHIGSYNAATRRAMEVELMKIAEVFFYGNIKVGGR